MQITKEQLNRWGACSDGVEWFNLNYPDGIADYQEILNKFAEDDHPDYASWLINKAGADADCLIEMDSVDGKKHLFVSGRLIVKNGIEISGHLIAGYDIKAGGGIKVGGSIKAGEGIKAGWGIEAGDDHGIFAGLRIKISRWKTDACVCAKHRPKNLISGYWKGDTDE